MFSQDLINLRVWNDVDLNYRHSPNDSTMISPLAQAHRLADTLHDLIGDLICVLCTAGQNIVDI